MYNDYVPDHDLDPPEDRRRVVGECMICEDEIREGDDCYNVPGYGLCCTKCIKDSRVYEIEIDY